MNRNLHSSNELTEFARHFDEEPETFFTKFVNKITNAYNTGYNTVNDVPSSSPHAIAPGGGNQSTSIVISGSSSNNSLNSPTGGQRQIIGVAGSVGEGRSAGSSSTTTIEEISESLDQSDDLPSEQPEGRTMLNVLKRISKIVASRNSNLRNYKDTDLHRLWMPDSKAKECYDCSVKFSTFRRKHHCRLCGQIFCSKCCRQGVPGKIIMCSGVLKVCTYCSKIVLSYLKSPDITQDLKSDLQALQEDLSSKLSLNQGDSHLHSSLDADNSPKKRKISVGYQEERLVYSQAITMSNVDRKNILQQSNPLKSLHENLLNDLPIQNCGYDFIEYLIANQKSANKVQAIVILNAMLEAGFLVPLVPDSDQLEFEENLHYKLLRRADIMSRSGSFQLDLNVDNTSVHLSRTPQDDSTVLYEDFLPPKSMDGSLNFQLVKDFGEENSMRATTKITTQLLKVYCEHEELLLNQLLRSYSLDQTWEKILIPLCARIANQFRPENCTNDVMDIRNYVNFKKIPGGLRQDSCIVGGVVFSKNVAHKEMATHFKDAKVLLLECPIVYERVEGRFVSIETILLQEKEYLRNVTTRILNLKPNVVVVHKNVAGVAQDMLRNNGITLVLDVKFSVLERLARVLQCDIVTSIESNIEKPKLGRCDEFYIESFEDGNGFYKTLMFFKMLSSPKGSCCLLRGANTKELARVKKVASFITFARYNWKLEMAFLLDEFARPPSPKRIIFDSKEHTPSEQEESSNCEGSESKTQKIQQTEKSNESGDDQTFQKKLVERKSDDKFVNIENVNDFSDPLRAPPELSEPNFAPDCPVEFAVETPYDNRFRTALSSTVLSVTPFVSFPMPYLETEQGQKCALRVHFPNELYFSKQWSENSNNNNNEKSQQHAEQDSKKKDSDNVELKPYHPFITTKITTSIDNRDFQTLLAEFRAFGGRYPKTSKIFKRVKRQDSYQLPKKVCDDYVYKDALDLDNHQRICVLFCSYYYNPKAPSSFCAQPILLDMKFYGQYDIMLGQFLQRYCFRSSYICQLCNLPMMDHVRRYVHSMGCVQVSLVEDTSKNDVDKIFLTSWCTICNEITPSVPISQDTWCLSFAKYLELRFHGHAYRKRSDDISADSPAPLKAPCTHCLHKDYIQYFSYKGIGVKFMYTPVEVWEIGLPPLVINLKKPKPFDNSQVQEDIKHFSVKGHEVYSRIHDRIAELSTEEENPLLMHLKTSITKDQLEFKQYVAVVQTLLAEKCVNSYDINDAMLHSKRALAESIEIWGPKLHEAAIQIKNSIQKSELTPPIDAGMVCTEDLKPEPETPTEEQNRQIIEEIDRFGSRRHSPADGLESCSDSPSPLQVRAKESKDVTDKKTIKQIISQLLPSNNSFNLLPSPIPANEHLTLPMGAFPILVHDQDLSSIIAYTLVSHDYKKSVENMLAATKLENCVNCSPNIKRKSQDGFLEPDDKDPSNKTDTEEKPQKYKSNSHIELSFQDQTTQFACKIYFALEFDKMRASVIMPPKVERIMHKELQQKQKDEQRNTNSSPTTPGDSDSRRESLASLTPVRSSEFSTIKESPEAEETRISLARSLCRSVQWEARGGKSGSKFSKTLDDRFVLKEMSKTDIGIFENFAPNYFEYVGKCFQQSQPTLLAKIFGIFRVSVKKKDMVQEKSLLIMENLFYDCDIKNKFDLKGSERNRMVDPRNQNGEIVLLDENLIQMSWSQPLYILSHSKTILREAINRDASFLEKNDVMDYSLLVGLNHKENVLVLGIIDYIRTFTLDKRIESLVKQTGLLGGQGKLPTVISPQRYKQRFSEAMDRYFYSVPDRWEGLSKK